MKARICDLCKQPITNTNSEKSMSIKAKRTSPFARMVCAKMYQNSKYVNVDICGTCVCEIVVRSLKTREKYAAYNEARQNKQPKTDD